VDGYREPDSAYPLGLAHYMKDTLEVSIILMTVLTVMATKTYKHEKLIQENSLVNQEEYQKHGYELGVNPVVKEEWQQNHEGQKAVENMPLPEFPRAIMMLNDSLINAQKTMTGAIDAAIGLASYSGESGIKVAQLQTAARTYQREDIEFFRRYVREIMTWLMDQIIMHRNYPHQIPGLKPDNTRGPVDVATELDNRLDHDEYMIEIRIQDNEEVTRQIELELYQYLVDAGWLEPIEFMRKANVQNPEKKLEAAETYYGDRKYLDLIKGSPEVKQMLDQFVAQMQTQPQAKGDPNAKKTV